MPALPVDASSTPTLLGDQSFYTMLSQQLSDKASLSVNVASGDLLFEDTTLQLAGIAGHDLDLDLSYNSLSNGAGGGADFGSDWVMSAGGDVKLSFGSGTITYQGPSSFQQVFSSNGSGGWTTPAGMDATLAGPNGSSDYTLTYHDDGQVLTFNTSGQLIDNADRNGNTFTYAYNGSGNLTEVTDASGREVSFTPGSTGNITSFQEVNSGSSTTLGRSYTLTYDGNHNLLTYADAMPGATCSGTPVDCTQFTYDTSGHHELVEIQDPDGHVTNLTYDSSHRVTEISQIYDGSGDTYTETFTYNSGATGSNCTSNSNLAGNTQVVDADGHTTQYCWDSSGRVIQEINALGATLGSTTTTWNSDDKPLTVEDPDGNTTTNTYDSTGEKLTKVEQGSTTGPTTTYTYGSSNNPYAPSEVADSNGNDFYYTYSSSGNVASMKNGLSSQNTTYYVDDGDGSLYGVEDALGQEDADSDCGVPPGELFTQCATYDSNGALEDLYNPAPEQPDSFTNDADSRRTEETDGDLNQTTYKYDNDDRVTYILYDGITSPSSCPTPPSEYCTTFNYDADGNLLSMVDQTGTTTYTYNKVNRLTSESESLTGSETCSTNPNSCTSYTYDGVGNIKTLTNGAGTTYSYYDAANHLTSMKDPGGNTITFTVDNDGNRKTTAYPNGVALSMTYNAADQLSDLSSAYDTSTAITNWSYTYTDPSSQATDLPYTADQSVGSATDWSDAYDAMDNLTQDDETSGGTTDYNYAYNGNADDCGTSCSSPSMTYDPSTALATWGGLTYVYENHAGTGSDGDLTSITGGTANVQMYYNEQNQLQEECNGGCTSGSTTYAYRGVGQTDRASATGYDGTQDWTSDLLGVSTETNTNSYTGCTCYYVRDTDGTLVEEILTTGTHAGTYYPIFDGEGSVVALTDSSGTVKDTFSYTPLGMIAAESEPVYEPWQFQGEYADNTLNITTGAPDNQLGAYQYHDGDGYYEAGQMNGHFIQPDPSSSPLSTSDAGSDTANPDACDTGDNVCLIPGLPGADAQDLCLLIVHQSCSSDNQINFFEVQTGNAPDESDNTDYSDDIDQLISIVEAVWDCGKGASTLNDITEDSAWVPGLGRVFWVGSLAVGCAVGGGSSYFLGYNLLG